MKLELIVKSDWCAMRDCPSLYRDKDGRLFIQGYITSDASHLVPSLPAGETLVEIDASLLDKIKNINLK